MRKHYSSNTPPRELEFKFAVHDTDAFSRLINYLDLPLTLLDAGVAQINHFFDTESLSLHSARAIARLREHNGRFTLTVKEITQADTGECVLSNRMEYESDIPVNIGRVILNQKVLSLACLKDTLKSNSDAVVALLKRCGIDRDLTYIGNFTNTRTHVPITLTANHRHYDLVMELDASEFPGQLLSYEIEVEISFDEDAASIHKALEQLLKDAGIDWHTTTNKAARFYDARQNQINNNEDRATP